MLIFVLVVGLFLIYIFEHDNMLDHHMVTDGISFTAITAWIIVIIDNLTVALEFMSDARIAFLPKNIYCIVCLVLYLLTSFTLGRYHKPEFKWTTAYVAGRVGACAVIVAGALITDFDPKINLVIDTLAVWFALWHEGMLYRRSMKPGVVGASLGMAEDEDD